MKTRASLRSSLYEHKASFEFRILAFSTEANKIRAVNNKGESYQHLPALLVRDLWELWDFVKLNSGPYEI